MSRHKIDKVCREEHNINAARYEICKRPKQMTITQQHSLSEYVEIRNGSFYVISHRLYDLFIVPISTYSFHKRHHETKQCTINVNVEPVV